MIDEIVRCEIYQCGELYNCRVYIGTDLKDDIALGCIRCDKIKITYNTVKKKFVVRFIYGGMRLVESDVNKISIYNLEEKNNISLPDYEAEWPYDDIEIDMKES